MHLADAAAHIAALAPVRLSLQVRAQRGCACMYVRLKRRALNQLSACINAYTCLSCLSVGATHVPQVPECLCLCYMR
jgi:hypothetical protein